MTALADTAIEITDDRLAARNALVLAVAQALAGGNNTVVVATGGIAGSMLAPDPMLATLPISVMVVGMWLGTLPVGMLAKAFGRRFALQVGSALRRAVRLGLVPGHAVGIVLAVAVRHAMRRPLCRSASILSVCRRRYRERPVPRQGDILGPCRRHLCRRDRAAACHFHQGRLAGLSVRGDIFGAVGVRGPCRAWC